MHLCLKTGYRGVAAEATMAATVRMPLSIQSNLVVTNLLRLTNLHILFLQKVMQADSAGQIHTPQEQVTNPAVYKSYVILS